MLHYYANPQHFLRLARKLTPWLLGVAVGLLAVGLVLALVVAPPERYQHDAARIMHVHVPAAWMSLFVYAVMAVASALAFINKHPLGDVAAKAAAPLGAVFTALALVTGMLWGKPTWGAWWVWDGRLTSELILLFIYIAYIALWDAIEEPARAARVARVLCLVGAVNLPIIHFSVEWWQTLHQGVSVFRSDGPQMPASMLVALLVMALGYNVLFAGLHLVRMRAEILARRLRTLRLNPEGALA
jgi:heme exporter protein C